MTAMINKPKSEPSKIQSHSREEDLGGGTGGTKGFTPIGSDSLPMYEV